MTVPDKAAVNRWKAFLLANYQTATARTYLTVLKVFYRWLTRQGFGKDEAAQVKGIRLERGFRRDYLPENAVKRVLARLEERMKQSSYSGSNKDSTLRNFILVMLLVSCGLRVSEVSSLDVGDLGSIGGKPIIRMHGKGRDGKVDFVPLTPSLKCQLFRYLEQRGTLPAEAPMFVSYSRNSMGRRLTSQSISRIVKRALVDAGFDSPQLTAHSLRHTAVTLALKGGATLQQVQQFARHRLIETTLRYAHNLEAIQNPCPELVMKLIEREEAA